MKMKKTAALLLAGAMALSLAACGAPARVIPGTYKTVSLIQMPDYVLNEDDTYEHGEEKGTYTADDNDNLTLQAKDSDTPATLMASDAYYYDSSYAMTEDSEYGTAPAFENGVSSQTFTTTVNATEVTLALSEDGTYQLSTSVSAPEYPIVDNVMTYEGTYTLDKEVLNLTWNDMDFPFLFVDEAIYVVVYEQENDENADAIAQRQTAVSDAETAAKDGRWWTAVDDALSAEIIEKAQGTWKYTEPGAYGLTYALNISGDYMYATVTLLGYPAKNQGSFTVCNDVLLIKYDGGTQGYVCIPYTYENGELKLYPLNALTEEETQDPAMQFVTDEQISSGTCFAKVS